MSACWHIAGVRCPNCWDVGRPSFGAMLMECQRCIDRDALLARVEKAEAELARVKELYDAVGKWFSDPKKSAEQAAAAVELADLAERYVHEQNHDMVIPMIEAVEKYRKARGEGK